MKLEDVKLGQILKDKFGNKYRVTSITNDDLQSVFVTCIEFKQKVCVGDFSINECGYRVWLLNDRNILLSDESPSGKKIAKKFELFSFLKSYQKITISFGFKNQNFLLCRSSFIDKIDVTLSDLEEDVVVPDYLTEDNIKIGMKVSDGLGNEYIVDDYVDDSVELLLNMETTSVDGESCVMPMKTRIKFYNETEKHLITTKNFRIIKGEIK